jgi:hypothetical protein
MFSLSLRPARLNQDYRGKTNEKDGEVTKMLTFGLVEVPLDEAELGAITQRAHAYRSMYDFSGPQPEPFFDCFKPREMKEVVEKACVEIRLHGGSEYKFTGCTLSKIRLTESSGGKTLLSCKVEASPALDDTLSELVANFGEIIDVAIHGTQASDQKDLPLSTVGTGEEPEKKRKPGRQRKGNGAPATH